MVSIGIMTIGAMAVLALQQQIIRANVHARQITIATQIAQNWIERLKMDATIWDLADKPPAATHWLKAVGVPNTLANFTTIEPLPETSADGSRMLSNAFDYYGDDLDNSTTAPVGLFFCASHRLNWVYANQRIIRADVRVWWAREGESAIRADYPRCVDDGASLSPGGDNFERYHIVYLSTVIRAS